jgi:phosphoglycerol transferase MdoB-like AlkP superfamily enzyme
MLIKKYLTYYFFWIGYFLLARSIFLLYHFSDSQNIGFQKVIQTFTNGIRLDLSAAGYFSALPFLFIALSELGLKKNFRSALISYTALFLFVASTLIFIDLGLYKPWGFRLDDTFLKYLLTPTEMTATISSYPIFTLFFLFLLTASAAWWFFKKMISNNLIIVGVIQNHTDNETQKSPFLLRGGKFILGLLLTIALIIPIRGGFQLAPVNQSAVYFSDSQFANHAAVNLFWHFMVSTFEKTSEGHNPYNYYETTEAKRIVDSLFLDESKKINVLKNSKPNVIIITYESLTAKVIERLGGAKGVTPCFDSLCREGILFSNIYATGDRTDKGVVGVLSGYPAIPRANIMEMPRKSAQLPVLSQIFKKQLGYNTAFYYGGEAEFANMKSYLLNGQFSRLTTKENFQKQDLSSKWGAFDHVVFRRLLTDLQQVTKENKQPFFINLLTLSSHEPFEIPQGWEKKEGTPTDDNDEKFRRVHTYSDAALGEFIREAKKQDWWDNTLVVVIADHSSPHLEPREDWFAKFHIPMLWLGGALTVRDTTIETIGSQTDLAQTLLGQLPNLPLSVHKNLGWSKNLLTQNAPQFAYFAFANGIGFVQKQSKFTYDTEGGYFLQKTGQVSDWDVKKAKAYLQLTYQDYLDK